jgi:hypothetical protein
MTVIVNACGPLVSLPPLAPRSDVWFPPAVKAGASVTGATVIVNAAGLPVSLPPAAVPPSSTARTVTVATPLARKIQSELVGTPVTDVAR